VLTPLWLAAVDYTNRDSFLLKWMPGTLFVVASALVVYVMPVSEFRQWLFYTLRQVFIVWVLLYVAYVYFTAKTDVLKARLLRLKVPLIALCALCVLITMEDVITILVIDSTTFAQNALLPLYVSERNFSENILLICTAGLTLYASAETLRLRYKEPPTSETLESTNYQMADLIPSFCEKHGLTPREQVILEEVLQEKDNQNIATSQQLALGTVKAHVHNILKKTGTSSRLELIQLFWSE
jgi:DNA-binding CsgD family transcriptional regulator